MGLLVVAAPYMGDFRDLGTHECAP